MSFSGNKDEREQKQKAAELQDERQELMAKVDSENHVLTKGTL